MEFGVFPCLTMANTFANIVGGLALISLLVWAGIELIEVIKQPSRIETAIKEDLNNLKKKSNPKQFDGVESDKPFVKTRKKTNKTK